MMGSWSAAGLPAQTVTLYDGMRNGGRRQGQADLRAGAPTSPTTSTPYLPEPQLRRPEVADRSASRQEMIDEAVKAAKQADVVVAAVGESRSMSHESASRIDLVIPGQLNVS